MLDESGKLEVGRLRGFNGTRNTCTSTSVGTGWRTENLGSGDLQPDGYREPGDKAEIRTQED